MLFQVRMKKDLSCSRMLWITLNHLDLEFPVSMWSSEIHKFIASWGEFTSTLEDVMLLTRLPVFENRNGVG